MFFNGLYDSGLASAVAAIANDHAAFIHDNVFYTSNLGKASTEQSHL
jgi:hypothetical protein